jgi:hypothetical protein
MYLIISACEAIYNKWDFNISEIHKMKLGPLVVIPFFIGLIFAAAVWATAERSKNTKIRPSLPSPGREGDQPQT